MTNKYKLREFNIKNCTYDYVDNLINIMILVLKS